MNIENRVRNNWGERWAKYVSETPTKQHDYFISDHGRIKSVHKTTGRESLLKGSITGGFRTLNLRLLGNKNAAVYLHKFIAEHFLEKDDEEQTFVIHKDGDKNNNHFTNLRWATQRELTDWQIEQGVYDLNNRKLSPLTKMTEAKVRLLKKRLKEGKTKKKILARSFGITTMQVSRIASGENWGHVTIDDDD